MTSTSNYETNSKVGEAYISISNIGGINTASIAIQSGVTVLTGRNATNRTSLLRALNGVLGGTAATLKSNAEQGEVTLQLSDDEYQRTYTRSSTPVSVEGSPYTANEELVDSFVTLLEDNPARRAVERGEDLHDVIMEPVDTAAIERRIRNMKDKKETLESKLDRIQRKQDERSELEDQRDSIQEEIANIDSQLTDLHEKIEEIDADAESAEEANRLVDKLDEKHQSLRNTGNDLELVESEISALKDDLESVQSDLEALPDEQFENKDEVEAKLNSLRKEKRELDNIITSLTTIIEFNTELLNEDSANLPGVEPNNKDIAAALAPDESQEIICWTCGSTVEKAAISDRLDDLRSVIEKKQGKRNQIRNEIEELNTKIQQISQKEGKREELERKTETLQNKIKKRESKVADLEAKASNLRDEIVELEQDVAATEAHRGNDLLDTYEQVSDLEYERGQLKNKLERVNDDLAEIGNLEDPDDLRSQIDELTEGLQQERTRINDLENDAVSEFNSNMDDILDVLSFDNLARVWIERKMVNSGRGPSETRFDLHVVREDESGTVYEDVVNHLSESEREVVGLVVALAGYLAHEVYDTVPFMILDSLEAIDSDRIADLIDYFAEFTPYLAVALLPEDAQALPSEYNRLSANKFTS